MFDDGHVEHARVLERASHQQRRRHRPAVVGNRDAARLLQLRDVGELFTPLPSRDRADRIHARQVRVRGLLEHVLRHAGVVVHRVGVGHARNGREAAGDGSGGTGRHGFLVLLSRLPQMHVHVDEPGTDNHTARNLDDDDAGFHRQIAADAGDAIAVYQQVEHAVAAVGRVDQPSALKQPLHLQLHRRADTAPPSARRRRWRPARGSPNTDRRPHPTRSRRRGSSARDA